VKITADLNLTGMVYKRPNLLGIDKTTAAGGQSSASQSNLPPTPHFLSAKATHTRSRLSTQANWSTVWFASV